jgi:uncharacterized protein
LEKEVRYLVDTNVWLERLLDQDKSDISAKFFELASPESMLISDFSLHSIGVILFRYKKFKLFDTFIEDLFINAKIEVLSLDTIDLLKVSVNSKKLKLDFDDSCQLTLAQKFDLTLITFDMEFIAKGLKVKSPDEIM